MTWGEQMLAQGEERGLRSILRKQLQRRFGPLPAEIVEKIERAPSMRLEEWLMRLLDARSLDDALAE